MQPEAQADAGAFQKDSRRTRHSESGDLRPPTDQGAPNGTSGVVVQTSGICLVEDQPQTPLDLVTAYPWPRAAIVSYQVVAGRVASTGARRSSRPNS